MKIQTQIGDLTPHEDAFAHSIRVGDTVVFEALNRGTWLQKGVVIGHTRERVRLIEVDNFGKLNAPRDTSTTSLLGGDYNLAQCFRPDNVAVFPEPLLPAARKWFAG